MKMKWYLGAALVSTAGMACAGEPVAFYTNVRVALDAAGAPTEVQGDPEMPGLLRERIEQMVKEWRFSPPLKSGSPVSGVTYLRLGACAVAQENGSLNLSVDYKGNGPGGINLNKIVPRYPIDAVKSGISADLVAVYTVGTDGLARLEEIKDLTKGRSKSRARWFQATIQDWVSELRFKPEELAGQPVATRMETPVQFELDSSESVSSAQKKLMEKSRMTSECIAAMEKKVEPGFGTLAIDSPFAMLDQK